MEEKKSDIIAPGWGANSSFQLVKLEFPNYFTLRYKDGTEQELVDFSSGSATNLTGIPNTKIEDIYRNPEFCSPFVNYGAFHPEKEKLARRLLDAVGFENGLVYRASTGTQAGTTAIKLAWLAQHDKDKKIILSPKGSYFGHDPATLAAGYWSGTGDHDSGESYNDCYLPEEITEVFQHLPSPEFEGSLVEHLEKFISQNGNVVAAIMLEPVQFVGATTPRENYYEGINEVAEKHDILIIADECATFARFGSLFASENLGLKPDIYNVGKGLSNSYEKVAAVLVSEEIKHKIKSQNIPEAAKVMFGSTLDWQPRDVYVVNAVLDEIVENGLLKEGLENSLSLQKKLEMKLEDEESIIVSGRGGWSTITFPDDRIAGLVRRELMRNHNIYSYRSGKGINMLMPLVKTEENLNNVAEAVLESHKRTKQK